MAIAGAQTKAHLGRYELLARLATGGMGEIFLARLEGAAGFEKLYVVKRILPHLADDARFREMLIAEARIASRLSHANICQVYELGETDGQLYIVMEYLEGVTLLPLLRRASRRSISLDLGLVAGVVQQVCEALHYAHELKDQGESVGLVHRDVTPSNVFITESGVVKVLDFGIAKARGASTQTQEGAVKGKYAYMAPEQLRGAEIDRRVDLFALGVVVFEMLALRRLFQRKTDYLTFRAVMEQPIPDIRRYRPEIPEAVALALARALDRDADNRFDSARQLGTTLLDALGARRPWTQGEIGDFVRSHFGDKLGRRAAQVQTAVQRVQATAAGAGRMTMPLIAQDDPEPDQHEGDDDDAFPSVETDIDIVTPYPVSPPTSPSALRPRASSSPTEFIEGTPPPFTGESTIGSLRPIDPLVGALSQATASLAALQPRRSIVWPLLATAMVGIAGAALYLVYQQTQRTQTVVKIEQTTTGEPAAHPVDNGSAVQPSTNVVAQDPPVPQPVPPPVPQPGSGSSTVSPPRVTPTRPSHPRNEDPHLTALRPHIAELQTCVVEHQDDAAKLDHAAANVTVEPNGTTKAVHWIPDALDGSALGGCMKKVLLATRFPAASNEVVFTWTPALAHH
jgi:serine/threonine-protein kinase